MMSRKFAGLAAALAGAVSLYGSPVTDDCVAGRGCIQTPDGKRGVFDVFAQFDVETHTFSGSISYNDANYSVSSSDLYDYADPEGQGGYRILSFRLNDPDYPDLNEIRVVVDDLGAAVDDTFEIQLLGGGYYAVSGKLLAECEGGIAISQDCDTGGGTTGGGTGGGTGGSTGGTPPEGECPDWVKGAGWVLGPNGSKVVFGLWGGMKDGLKGGFKFLDFKTRMNVKSTGLTSYLEIGSNGRQLNFNVLINGVAGTAVVKVFDNGSSGDVFELQLSTGYSVSGTLLGGCGNIKLVVEDCPPKPAPTVPNCDHQDKCRNILECAWKKYCEWRDHNWKCDHKEKCKTRDYCEKRGKDRDDDRNVKCDHRQKCKSTNECKNKRR